MDRRLIYIINPISGARDKSAVEKIIRHRTQAGGFAFSIYPSVASGDYSFLLPVIKEQRITDIVIAGGDGTINQVVNTLRHLKLRFGILPSGSGNGLAFSASIPKNIDRALDLVFSGVARPVDAFLVNGRFACMLCGIGFDAQVAHDFAHDPRRGLATYIRKTVGNFFSARAYPFALVVGGKKIRMDAFFVSVANSNQFGNHFTIAPKASLTDGLLDIVIMAKQNKVSLLFHTAMQVAGLHALEKVEVIDEKASLLYFQTDKLTVMNPRLAPMHIDGDPVETSASVEVEIIKACFQLIGGKGFSL